MSVNLDIQKIIQKALRAHQAGRLDSAEKIYKRIRKRLPNDVQILHNFGMLLLQRGQYRRAAALFEKATEIKSEFWECHANLGRCYIALNEPGKAIGSFRKAQIISPKDLRLNINLAAALKGAGQLSEAEIIYRKILESHPGNTGVLINLGNILTTLERFDDAIHLFLDVLNKEPNNHEARYNIAITYQEIENYDRALENYAFAIKAAPDNALINWGYSLLLWKLGRYSDAWRYWDARLDRPIMGSRQAILQQPLWDGKPFKGKTLFLYSEQGHGDTIQFARFIPLAKELGGTVVVECQPALKKLMGTVAGVDRVISRNEPVPSLDVQCAIMSLPAVFSTDESTLPSDVPYLYPPKSEKFQKLLGSMRRDEDITAGFVWAGNPENGTRWDARRSLSATAFASLAAVPSWRLYNLQYGTHDDATEQFFAKANIGDLSPHIKDFADLSGYIDELDHVISVDTSVAHLAGALGKSVWLLEPTPPDYRWLLNRETTPWYPTMRIFRQPNRGDWSSVLREVESAMTSLA